MKYEQIGQLLAIDEFESQDGGIFLTEEQANLIDDQLDTLHAELASGTNERTALVQQLADSKAKEHDLQLEIQRLNEHIDTLGQMPAAPAAVVVTDSNTLSANADKTVFDPNADFLTNLQKIGKEYF